MYFLVFFGSEDGFDAAGSAATDSDIRYQTYRRGNLQMNKLFNISQL